MKHSKKLLTLIFATVLFTGLAVADASAQRRGGRFIRRPVIVRQYYVQRYNPYWYWNSWDSPYFYDPYLSERRQRYYLERELRGNREELRKHLEKYNADGVITAKERKELDDDYRDVARSQRNLNQFRRRYY
ncbi:MAG TPA: hypothetical protein VGB68_06420 [Pyrinomonadaceae bacterium]|jgi:hypothetical protein